jgi:mannose-6-phosphate isomerase-like protein (cupin superfamily)
MARVHQLEDLRSSETACLFEGGKHADGMAASMFVTTPDPGRGPGLHVHPYPELFLVELGEATFTIGEEQVVTSAGQVVVVPADTPHRFENTGSATLRVVSFHPSPEVEQTDL